MGDKQESSDALDTVDVFSLLGEQSRLEIVDLLYDGPFETPVAFSTLYDHTALEDSAQFNYHLKQLRPHFVRKGEAGYELTAAGRRLGRAVVAGSYTASPEVAPFDIEGGCYACGETTLEASYADEVFSIECRGCGESVLAVRVPPTVVRGRTGKELVGAFERWSRYQVEQARAGICPACGGRVEPRVADDLHDSIAFDAVAAYDCTVCGRSAMTSFGAIAARQPAVESFHERRGEPLRDRRLWEIDQLVAGEHVEVRSRDPWLVRVSFYADGDACTVDIDDSLAVVRTEIVPDKDPPSR